ncbi:hypothetical protein D3C76_747520 [compost metagenome]
MGVVAHTGLLAKNLGRTDPGATATEDVGGKNFLRRPLDVVLVNVADERGNIDFARAGIHAGRVVAIQATRGFQVGLAIVEWRRQVGEMAGEGGRILNGMREVSQGLDHGVGLTVIEVLPLSGIVFVLTGPASSLASQLLQGNAFQTVGAGLLAKAAGRYQRFTATG